MPRPNDSSPLRKVVEQTIMWVILAATVAAAAMVDMRVNQLGEPIRFDGIDLRLPEGWERLDEDEPDQITLRERADTPLARMITVRHESSPWGLDMLFRAPRPQRATWTIQVELPGGQSVPVSVFRVPYDEVYELSVVATLTPTGSGKKILITIVQPSFDPRGDAQTNLRLMRRILETVRFQSP